MTNWCRFNPRYKPRLVHHARVIHIATNAHIIVKTHTHSAKYHANYAVRGTHRPSQDAI